MTRLRTANRRRQRRREYGAVLIRGIRRTRKRWYLMWPHKSVDDMLDDVRALFRLMAGSPL